MNLSPLTSEQRILVDNSIRRVPDFPKEGISFYDITGMIAVPEANRVVLDAITDMVGQYRPQALVGVEARGFVFAAPLAARLNLPLVLLRKKGKLPNPVRSQQFRLEYGRDEICLQIVDGEAYDRVVLIDDLLATGGTIEAGIELFSSFNTQVEAVIGVVGLPFLGYDERLAPVPVHTVINYDSE